MNHDELYDKAKWVFKETLKLHGRAKGIRIASALSPIELFITMFYGGVLKHDPKNEYWEGRDRLVISKGHGVVSLFPILADRGYFPLEELERINQEGALLVDIPDSAIPGFETTNGSLGHGLGVGCGIAQALKTLNKPQYTYVLMGDGELYEGSVWEAVMYAPAHGLENLILIIDNNKLCMLDRCEQIININPLEAKFEAFGWEVFGCDGHDINALLETFNAMHRSTSGRPKVFIADTIKGRGVEKLEQSSLCHILALKDEEIDALVGEAL